MATLEIMEKMGHDRVTLRVLKALVRVFQELPPPRPGDPPRSGAELIDLANAVSEGGTSISDGDEHEYDEHDEPLPVSRVRLGTEEDLQRDFGSTPLLIGSPVTSKPQQDVLAQPNIPDRSRRVAAIEASGRRRTANDASAADEESEAWARLEELMGNAPGTPLFGYVDPLEEIRTWTLVCGCEVVGSFLGIRGDNVETPNTAHCFDHGRQAIVSSRPGG
jgi:hypothetical protein